MSTGLHERDQQLSESAITRAALRARTVYPGPVGLLVCRELLAWAEFGHRLGSDALVAQLVREIMGATDDPAEQGEVRRRHGQVAAAGWAAAPDGPGRAVP